MHFKFPVISLSYLWLVQLYFSLCALWLSDLQQHQSLLSKVDEQTLLYLLLNHTFLTLLWNSSLQPLAFSYSHKQLVLDFLPELDTIHFSGMLIHVRV